MWDQYKKTFWGMQILSWGVTLGILVWSHLWALAALFLVTMQIGAVLGALWGSRLKNKIERAALQRGRG